MRSQKKNQRIKKYKILSRETSATLYKETLLDRNILQIVFRPCGKPPWPPCIPPSVILRSKVSGTVTVNPDRQTITYRFDPIIFEFPQWISD
jgi:hypothetical protein